MNPMSPRVLFIYRRFHIYNGDRQVSNGLRTSASLVVEMLESQGYDVHLAEAVDGNSIDALVAKYRPDRVVIEAIWVTPKKMAELQRLWPGVAWTVRVHSELAFLAGEGMAIGWLAAYLKQGIEVAFNSGQTANDFRVIGTSICLPNYYPVREERERRSWTGVVNIGCFGAIRPLKNQLIQAFAACGYADKHRKEMIFHMNGSRIEQNGSNNLKNIQALFDATGYTLELHPWMDHAEFLELVARMDLCLGVSLSESFMITATDAVSQGVPFVGSEAIRWLPLEAQAPVDSVDGIVAVMEKADSHRFVKRNLKALESFSSRSVRVWKAWMSFPA